MNNNSTNDDIDERRSIPMDLFPVSDKKLTNDWARNTYGWCHLFDENCETLVPRDDDDIINWLRKAKEIRDELQNIGNRLGEKQILYLAKNIFQLKMSGTISVSPTKIMDVVSIYADHEYYNQYKDKNIQELYQLVYGLTRNGGNSWLINAETDWMQGRNIK